MKSGMDQRGGAPVPNQGGAPAPLQTGPTPVAHTPAVDPSPLAKKAVKYSAERVIGNGSFGIVYQAITNGTKETVAIKKVLQDRRYKNRELQIMKLVNHPNIVGVRDCFYSRGNRGRDVYLNLVMEYIPETVYQTIRAHARKRQTIPYLLSKIYSYQICRAIAYCHSIGICHRDIKPQNLLLDPVKQVVKLCDFGSAKVLEKGAPNVAYICSRYYRAPELIFEASDYTTSIDTWSLGCIISELFLGQPLFQGGSGVDQLVEIIKVLGAPSKEEILAMNKNYTQFRFPQVKPLPWETVFTQVRHEGKSVPADAIELIRNFLVFNPRNRTSPFEALASKFFDELREPTTRLPTGEPLPPLFNLTAKEAKKGHKLGILDKIVPAEKAKELMTSVDSAPDPSDAAGAEPPQ